MAHKSVTVKAGKKAHKAKAHKKHAHHVSIHKIENGFKTLSHYEPDMDENGMMGGYQEPEEHAFSGDQAHAQVMDHVMGAMGMQPPAAAPAAAPAVPAEEVPAA